MWMLTLCAVLGQTPDDTISRGIGQYDALDYAGTLEILQPLADDPELTPKQRAQVLAYLARAHASLKQRKQARQRFRQVLELDPTFDVSWEESPRIRNALAAARKALASGDEDPAGDPEAIFAGPEQTVTTPITEPVAPAADPTPKWWLWAGAAAGVLIASTVFYSWVTRDDEPAPVLDSWTLP